jgi:hypothetical protein
VQLKSNPPPTPEKLSELACILSKDENAEPRTLVKRALDIRHPEASEWGRDATGECFITARYTVAEQSRLSQSPGSRDDAPVFTGFADNQEDQN